MANWWGVPKGSFKLWANSSVYWKFCNRQLANLVNLQRPGGSGKPLFWPPLKIGNCWGVPKGLLKLLAKSRQGARQNLQNSDYNASFRFTPLWVAANNNHRVPWKYSNFNLCSSISIQQTIHWTILGETNINKILTFDSLVFSCSFNKHLSLLTKLIHLNHISRGVCLAHQK